MIRLWDQLGVPHRGWQYIHVVDRKFAEGDYYEPAVCEMCGQPNLRFIHTMRHDDYSSDLNIGCVCAEKMENDCVAPKQREQRHANRLSRRRRWLTRKWKVSRAGNPYLNIDGYKLVVFPDEFTPGEWRYLIAGDGIETTFSDQGYKTEVEAKLTLFDEFAEVLGW